jgi:hypothetical protein
MPNRVSTECFIASRMLASAGWAFDVATLAALHRPAPRNPTNSGEAEHLHDLPILLGDVRQELSLRMSWQTIRLALLKRRTGTKCPLCARKLDLEENPLINVGGRQ